MTDQTKIMLYGIAIHEAGHAIVMDKVGIGVDEVRLDGSLDDPSGATVAIHFEKHFPLVDQIAARLGGIEAEKIFESPTTARAQSVDKVWVESLVSALPPEEREPYKEKGSQRARCLIQQHKAKLERLADLLVEQRKVSRSEFFDLMNS